MLLQDPKPLDLIMESIQGFKIRKSINALKSRKNIIKYFTIRFLFRPLIMAFIHTNKENNKADPLTNTLLHIPKNREDSQTFLAIKTLTQ